MKPETLKRMQYFVGKVCTIVTTSMNRQFDETTSRRHFVVRVGDIGPDGVWGVNPHDHDVASFFAMPHVISIQEEVELDPEDPADAAMISEYEKKTGRKVVSDLPPAPKPKVTQLPVLDKVPEPVVGDGDANFVDIATLERLAETTKRTYEAYDTLGKQSTF